MRRSRAVALAKANTCQGRLETLTIQRFAIICIVMCYIGMGHDHHGGQQR